MTIAAAIVAVVALPLAVPGPAVGAPVANGSWAPVLPPTRMVVKAVPLANGKVLAAGYGSCQAFICFEVYDPVLNVWTPAGSVGGSFGSMLMTLTPLSDGGALVWTYEHQRPTDVKRYRFNGTRFVPFPPIDGPVVNARNNDFTATLLDPPLCRQPVPPADYPCGKVFVMGGINNTRGGVESDKREPRTAELYSYGPDPDDPGELLPLADLPEALLGHRGHAAVLLADGRVLVIGGNGTAEELTGRPTARTEVDVFDPRGGALDPTGQYRLGTWSAAAPLPASEAVTHVRDPNWAVRLLDGRVLIGGSSVSTPMVFDPGSGEPVGAWTPIATCEGVEHCGAPAVLPDGTVLAVGWYQPYATAAGPSPLSSPPLKAFRLDPSADPDPTRWAWAPVAPDPVTPAWTATLLDGGGDPSRCGARCGSVLVAGGLGHILGPSTGSAQLFELLRLTGLSSPAGPACGGQRLTVTGTRLHDVAAVNFGAVAVSDLAVNDGGTEVTVTTPRHPPASVPVTVTTRSGGTSPVNPDITYSFERVGPATITGLSPGEGRAAGGTAVGIEGSFVAECVRSVDFGDQPAASYALDPAGRITATSPGGEPGQQVRVSVGVDPGPPAPADSGIPSVASRPGADVFTYLALPAVSAISPPRGPAFGGQSVTLTGTGLEGATEVRFGEAKVPPSGFTANSAGTSISATLPGHDPGTVPVTLTTPTRGDSLASAAPQFTYHPGISGLFPPSGPLTGGTQVTIAGRGFTGAQAVRFGAASVVPISLTDTEIVVKTPPHGLPEAVPVSLTAAGLNSLPENVMFNYGLADVVDPDPVTDPGSGPPKQNTTTVEPAPPGGSPVASPSNAPSLSSAPTPGVAPTPGAAPTPGQAPLPGQAPTPAQVVNQSASPSNSPAALPPPIPVASPVAAPGTAMGQGGPGANQGVAGAGEDDEGQGAHRYAMSDARTTLALGAAGATGCFTFLAAARREPARRRRRSGARRPQPKGAY